MSVGEWGRVLKIDWLYCIRWTSTSDLLRSQHINTRYHSSRLVNQVKINVWPTTAHLNVHWTAGSNWQTHFAHMYYVGERPHQEAICSVVKPYCSTPTLTLKISSSSRLWQGLRDIHGSDCKEVQGVWKITTVIMSNRIVTQMALGKMSNHQARPHARYGEDCSSTTGTTFSVITNTKSRLNQLSLHSPNQ